MALYYSIIGDFRRNRLACDLRQLQRRDYNFERFPPPPTTFSSPQTGGACLFFELRSRRISLSL